MMKKSPGLAVKTSPPRLPGFVIDRPRLIKIFDNRDRPQISLLTSPPGYGKSTLLSLWLNFQKAENVWLCLDENDNDPMVFWEYLFVILEIDHSLLSETANKVSPNEMTALILAVLEAKEEPVTMVLDDYHNINNQDIHSSLGYFLFHLPPPHKIIILSRTEPPLALGRLRMTGRLLEIRTDDLAFDEEETTRLLSQSISDEAGSRYGRELKDKTEGWAAAISLTVLAMKCSDQNDVMEKLGGADRYIADFLVEEVLRSLEAEEFELLLEMSVPDYFSGSMIASITGRKKAAALVESFRERNFFIISDSSEKGDLHFHPFFRQFLIHRLNKENPDKSAVLNRRTAEFYLENNNIEEALEYAFRCKDGELINELLEPVGARLWGSRRLFRFEKWIVGDPGLNLAKFPSILLYMIRVHLHKGEVEEAFGKLKQLEETLSAGSDPKRDQLKISMLMIKATVALYRNDLEEMRDYSQEAIGLIGDEINRLKGMALTFFGVSGFYSGTASIGETIDIFQNAYRESVRANDWVMAFSAGFHRALFYRLAGELHSAADEIEIIEEKIKSLPMPLNGVTGNIKSEKALWLCEQGEYGKAVSLADRGLELSYESCTAASIWWSLYIRTQVLYNTGQYDESLQSLEMLEKKNRISSVPLWFLNLYFALKIQILVSTENLESAKSLIHEKGLSGETDMDRIHIPLQLARARYLIAVKRDSEAKRILTLISARTGQSGIFSLWIEAGLMLVPLLEDEEKGSGVEFLGEILEFSYAKGYFASIYREGDRLLPFLNGIKFNGKDQMIFLRRIVKSMEGRSKELSKGPVDFDLTEREKEVLVLMEKGYSNREISELLFISMNTTKTHLKNINSKLGSENRTQAVSMGREAGIC